MSTLKQSWWEKAVVSTADWLLEKFLGTIFKAIDKKLDALLQLAPIFIARIPRDFLANIALAVVLTAGYGTFVHSLFIDQNNSALYGFCGVIIFFLCCLFACFGSTEGINS